MVYFFEGLFVSWVAHDAYNNFSREYFLAIILYSTLVIWRNYYANNSIESDNTRRS